MANLIPIPDVLSEGLKQGLLGARPCLEIAPYLFPTYLRGSRIFTQGSEPVRVIASTLKEGPGRTFWVRGAPRSGKNIGQ